MGDFRLREVARLVAFEPGPEGGVALDLGAARGVLRIARDGAVQLRLGAGALAPDPAEAIGFLPWRPSRAEPFPREEEGGLGLAHAGPEGCASVEVDEEPFAVRVRDREGNVLAALSDFALGEDGRARVDLAAPLGQRFHGFGEKTGGLDKRGDALAMRSRDVPPFPGKDPLYASIPFFLSVSPARPPEDPHARSTGFLWTCFATSRFDVAKSDPFRVRLEADAGGLDLTIFPGPHPRDVLRRYTARVGRMPLPPLWALGHHQSRWSYGSEAEVRRVAAELRRRGIPSDAIHLDIDYMDGFRVFTWDRRRFPDPKGLLRDLRAQGFRVVPIVDPGVKVDPAYPVYREGRARDAFCRNADGSPFQLYVWPKQSALPDFVRPEVRAWWGEQHRPLIEAGVAGVWNDMNEPAGWARELRVGKLILPWKAQDLSRVVQADPVDAAERAAKAAQRADDDDLPPGDDEGAPKRVPHEHVRNLYGQMQCRATREFLERAEPERRHFVLTRSGFAGVQRWAAMWTGDSMSRWSHLRLSLPMLLNLSLSGVAFCGADIGGFAGEASPELFARWMQIGALYPFARTHSMWLGRRQEPWRYGARVEAVARAALELRMRLLPYLYGLFHEAAASGAPVWRPLFWEFPDDDEAARVEDQVMVGPSLLAAPVLVRGARERELYLPPGVWYGFDDDARWVGPRRIRVSAPLERLPLFARAGAVIPTRSPVRHAGETPAEPLVLEVFPGADSDGVLIEDDGESTEHRHGAVARTALRLHDRAAGRLRLELGRREGGFGIEPRTLRVVFRASPAPRSVYVDALALPAGAGRPGWSASAGRVEVRLDDDGVARSVELDPAP